MNKQGQFENQEQESFPHPETAKWLEEIIEGKEYENYLEDGSTMSYGEVREPIWKLLEAFRQAEFSGPGGDGKYREAKAEAYRSLGREPNNSEGLIIGWIADMVSEDSLERYMAKKGKIDVN